MRNMSSFYVKTRGSGGNTKTYFYNSSASLTNA